MGGWVHERMDEVLRQAKGDSTARESLGGQEGLPCTSPHGPRQGHFQELPLQRADASQENPPPQGHWRDPGHPPPAHSGANTHSSALGLDLSGRSLNQPSSCPAASSPWTLNTTCDGRQGQAGSWADARQR